MIILDEPFIIANLTHSSFLGDITSQFPSASSTKMGLVRGVLIYCIVHRLLPPFYNKCKNTDRDALLCIGGYFQE